MTSPNENYTSWIVGMRVECVDARGAGPLLSVGAIYTIRALEPEFVTFEEPSTWTERGVQTSGWLYRRFRPVVTRKSDISVFQSILSNPHKKLPTRENA